MADFQYDPPLPPKLSAGPFAQTVRLVDAVGQEVGVARWHVADPATGVVQLLDLTVAAPHRRRGHGRRLLDAAVAQAKLAFAAAKTRPRRGWVVVGHKSQVAARAFLTHAGYHHVATIPNLLKGEDALVYSKGFD
ncbi:MAG TPA: GNAT family N-acetyltransferase [Tepidisphaeraceae bacterium]|nr:GNAT family N-acetyltransferase [Tepidisphaeraceae bacterium]